MIKEQIEPRCWPSDLVDEIMPSPRATPGSWLPYLLGKEPADEVGDYPARAPIAEGDIIEFIFREIVGSGVVVCSHEGKNAELKSSCADFELIRARDDGWTFASTVEDFAPEWFEANECGDECAEIPVVLERWPSHRYRAVRGESGEMILVAVEETPVSIVEAVNV